MVVLDVIPSHTDKKYWFKDVHFVGISADSLNHLLHDQFIMNLTVESNNEFNVYLNRVGERMTRLTAEYLTNVKFENLSTQITRDTFIPKSSPRILTLQTKIQNLQSQDQAADTRYQNQQSELTRLETEVHQTTDIYEKEKRQTRIRELRKIQMPDNNQARIAELKAQIAEIRKSDYLANRDKALAIENKYREAQPEETKFTGIAKLVEFEERKGDK